MNAPVNKLIIAAGVILVVLIAATILISSFSKSNQPSQTLPTLIPTTAFEGTGQLNLSPQEIQGLEKKVAEINSHILSSDQANRLDQFKNKLPLSTNDFAIGYSETLGQFFVQKKTAQADAALQKFFQDNNFSDVYQQFPDLFVTTSQPVDQAILQAEQNFSKLKNDFQQQQLNGTGSSSNQTGQQTQIEKQQALFFDFMKSLLTFNPGPTLSTDNNNGGGGSGNNNGGGNGAFADRRISQALMDIFLQAGNKVNIAPKLLAAIMSRECATVLFWPQNEILNHPTLRPGDPCYTNSGIAFGPMQFKPSTWAGWASRVKDLVNHQPNIQNISDAVFGAALKLKAAAQAKDPFNLTQSEVFRAAASYNGSTSSGNCIVPAYCQAVWGYYNSHNDISGGGGNNSQNTNTSGRTVGKTTVPAGGRLSPIEIAAATILGRYKNVPKATSIDWKWVTEATAVGLAESGGYCCGVADNNTSWGLWQDDAVVAGMHLSNCVKGKPPSGGNCAALFDPVINAEAMWLIQHKEVNMSQSEYGTDWGAYWSNGRPGAARFFKNAEFYNPAQQAAAQLKSQL